LIAAYTAEIGGELSEAERSMFNRDVGICPSM
jgi:hypothetical protein